jgi:HK97 family phage major capsid protein
VKLPRLKTDTAFGLLALSAAVTEKSPQTEWVTFTAEKFGGLVRIPSELDEDSIVAIGQFVARYSARQIAAVEDQVFFMNLDGSTYGAVKGLCGSTIDNAKVEQLASTKTAYSDATLAKVRALRAKVEAPAIGMGAYYAHPTFEQFFSGLNTAGDKPYLANGVNGASLDGFPIRWVDSMPAYSTGANASKVFLLFGDLSFQYLGVRGGVRFDTSADAAFTTDEILVRAIERFTIGLMATGAVAGLQTAAS